MCVFLYVCGYAIMYVGVRGQLVRVCSLLPWSPKVRLRSSGLMVKNLYTAIFLAFSLPLFFFFFLSFLVIMIK